MAALDAATKEGFDYYNIESILSEEEYVPCVLRHGCTGVGRILDPGSDLEDIAPETRVDMPLWMVQVMAKRQLVQVELPVYFKDHMRRKLRAGPGCENLRVRCMNFYTVAHKVHESMLATGHADDTFPQFISSTFAGRYKDLLTKAPVVENNAEASETQAKLSNEELNLFNAAAYSAAAHDRYKANKDSLTMWKKKPSLKRIRLVGDE